MAKREAQVRKALTAAVKKLGGTRGVLIKCGISQTTVYQWLKNGNLNEAKALNADRFAREAGQPLRDFLLEPEEK